jgi:tetratricopeptide (TPR) repeat protein
MFALIFGYSLIRRTGPIVAPTGWERDSTAGVRAVEAGRLDEAERYFTSAMNRAVQRGSAQMIGTSHQNIGWLQLKQKRYQESRDNYLKGLELLQHDPATRPVQLSALLGQLALAEVGLRRFADAEAHSREAIRIDQTARTARDPQVAQNLRNLAVILLAQGRPLEAAEAVRQADAAQSAQSTTSPLR